ncbi:MAG TPA: carboxypeptidase regulatory-like domain-containing protein [Pyrinomonadaceae bacterium]
MTKKIAFYLGLTVIFILSASSAANACTCAFGGSAPCQEYWRTDAVFSGTVIGSSSIEVKYDSLKTTERLVRVAINQSFRGFESGQVEIITGWGDSDCGYQFKLGGAYLIYATKRKSDGRLYTGICSRTRRLTEADSDLAFFNSLATAERTGTIFGTVVKTNYESTDGKNMFLPVSGAEVAVEGENSQSELRTDSKGTFSFGKLKPGKYKVLLTLPLGLARRAHVKDEGARIIEDEVEVAAQGCAQTDFYLESDTRVSGRVVDAKGEPISDLSLEMRGAESGGPNISAFLEARTDKDGRFEFSFVPPGNYLLGHRVRNSQHQPPYPRTYYPGVGLRSLARPITVKENSGVRDLELTMPSPLSEYPVEVQVVWSDGRDAPGASVNVVMVEHGELTASFSKSADAKGRLTITLLLGAHYQLSAFLKTPSGTGAQSEWVNVPALSGNSQIKLILPMVDH